MRMNKANNKHSINVFWHIDLLVTTVPPALPVELTIYFGFLGHRDEMTSPRTKLKRAATLPFFFFFSLHLNRLKFKHFTVMPEI